MVEATGPRMSYQGITAGVGFIIVAIALLIGWSTEDWSLMFPVLLLAFGIYGMIMGFVISATDRSRGFGVSESAYILIWGSLLTLLGIAWFINGMVPGSAPVILAMIFIFIGGAILVLSLTKMRRNR